MPRIEGSCGDMVRSNPSFFAYFREHRTRKRMLSNIQSHLPDENGPKCVGGLHTKMWDAVAMTCRPHLQKIQTPIKSMTILMARIPFGRRVLTSILKLLRTGTATSSIMFPSSLAKGA